MIIHKNVQQTLEASPLNSHNVRKTCGQQEAIESALKKCPIYANGRLF
jgi:hypothetical protein